MPLYAALVQIFPELAHTAVQVQRNYEAYMDAELPTKGEADRAGLMKRRMAFERKVTAGISQAARMLAKPFRGDSAASSDAPILAAAQAALAQHAVTPPPPARSLGSAGGTAAMRSASSGGAGAPGMGLLSSQGPKHAEPAAPAVTVSGLGNSLKKGLAPAEEKAEKEQKEKDAPAAGAAEAHQAPAGAPPSPKETR